MELEAIGNYFKIKKFEPTGMSKIYEVLDRGEIFGEYQSKILKTYLHEGVSNFFYNEAKILDQLNKKDIPGIIQSYGLLEWKDKPYLQLEKLEEPLEDYIQKGYFFERLGNFIGFMADVLEDLEREKIVHSDIKPGNVMLDKHGNFKLFDFGISYHPDFFKDLKTQEGFALGTPSYMAPEITKGSTPSPPTDRYSFGRTLGHLLLLKISSEDTKRLFGNTRPIYFTVIEQRNDNLIKKIKSKTTLPDDLENILRSTLQTEPKDRPTPQELREMNQEYMRNL